MQYSHTHTHAGAHQLTHAHKESSHTVGSPGYNGAGEEGKESSIRKFEYPVINK